MDNLSTWFFSCVSTDTDIGIDVFPSKTKIRPNYLNWPGSAKVYQVARRHLVHYRHYQSVASHLYRSHLGMSLKNVKKNFPGHHMHPQDSIKLGTNVFLSL